MKLAITGKGVISNSGIFKEIRLFSVDDFKVKKAKEILNFNPKGILGKKGLRNLDRGTLILMAATKFCLEDSGIDCNQSVIGMNIGAMIGAGSGIYAFLEDAKNNESGVNPALFPNTVFNISASQCAIYFGLTGYNKTISNGLTASLDAFNIAMNDISCHRQDKIIVGGVEEISLATFSELYEAGLLAENDDESVLFEKSSKGIILGEGSCVFMLELLEDAKSRDANIYAVVEGYGQGVNFGDNYNVQNSIERAILLALKQANIMPSDIDLIVASVNGYAYNDISELKVIKKIFSGNYPPLLTPKFFFGETLSAGGSFGVLSAIDAINENKAKRVIINAVNFEGLAASLVISKY